MSRLEQLLQKANGLLKESSLLDVLGKDKSKKIGTVNYGSKSNDLWLTLYSPASNTVIVSAQGMSFSQRFDGAKATPLSLKKFIKDERPGLTNKIRWLI